MTAKKKILLVEDDTNLGNLLQDSLELKNYIGIVDALRECRVLRKSQNYNCDSNHGPQLPSESHTVLSFRGAQ